MLFDSFRITGLAMAQIFLLGALGYLLVRGNVLGDSCLLTLSRLSMDVTLPLMIFTQIIREFSFSLYPQWWVFPLMSIGVTVAGALAALIFLPLVRQGRQKLEFISLVGFQNSGYLPLALVAAMMAEEQARPLFIYLFLFLMGFNLLMWSFGVYILSQSGKKKFALASLFSAPVIATLAGLLVVASGLNRYLPDALIKPLKMTGDCTLPLALLVVGGGLASIKLGKLEGAGQVALLCLVKLLFLPLLGLLFVGAFRIPYPFGFLLVMQLAMPSAATLSVIVKAQNSQDLLVSRGIFFTHLLGLLSIPVILSLYFAFYMIK